MPGAINMLGLAKRLRVPILKTLAGESYGDGTQARSFCDVSDLVDGKAQTMAGSEQLKGPIHLGTTCELPIRKLAENVKAAAGVRSQTVLRARLHRDPLQHQPDITKAHKEPGWEPKVLLDQGLGDTMTTFRTLLAA